MTDPRFTDPNYVDPRLSDPVDRNDAALRSNNQWGWIAGLAVIALIVIFLIAGGHNANQTAGTSPATTTGQSTTPPSTTGMGATSPRPATPSPTAPAPSATPAPAPADNGAAK